MTTRMFYRLPLRSLDEMGWRAGKAYQAFCLSPVANQTAKPSFHQKPLLPLIPPGGILHQMISITSPDKFRHTQGTKSPLFPEVVNT